MDPNCVRSDFVTAQNIAARILGGVESGECVQEECLSLCLVGLVEVGVTNTRKRNKEEER